MRTSVPSRKTLRVVPLSAGLGLLCGLVPLAQPASADEIREITFPVEGSTEFTNDFQAPRSGGRRHQGTDVFGDKLQELVATRGGTISRLRGNGGGLSGNMVTLTDDDGWTYWYMHVNNDSPGTDDGASPREWAFAEGVEIGSRVEAGQTIAYLGDSGNAESTPPHLHFEIHDPSGRVVNPFHSLSAADPDTSGAQTGTSGGRTGAGRTGAGPTGTGTASPGVLNHEPLARAVVAHPHGGHYVLMSDGSIRTNGAPQLGFPRFQSDLARAMVVTPDGGGYIVLDSLGRLHKFGTAATGPLGKLGAPDFGGLTIARSLAITPSGRGYAVLDGWGGVHPFGDAPRLAYQPYWKGQDIARAIAFSPSGKGIYVLDGWGGVHASGDARKLRPKGRWPGQDVARGLVVTSDGYAVVDARGGLHRNGRARPTKGGTYGGDWRGIAAEGDNFLLVRRDGFVERRSG